VAPVAAYGGELVDFWVAGLAADDHAVYVVRASGVAAGWLVVLDPTDGHELGQAPLSLDSPWGIAWAVGDLVLVADDRAEHRVAVVDVSDPRHPEELATVDLGRGSAPTAFTRWGDLVLTDGGATDAIELSDPADPRALSLDPPLDGPLVVGDDVLAATPDGAGCALAAWDPDARTSGPPIDTGGICLGAGLVPTSDGALGFGWLDQTPVVERLTRGDGGWTASSAFPLDLDRLDTLVGVGSDAFALGDHGVLVGGVGDRPTRIGEWAPAQRYSLRSATAQGGRIWVSVSRESGDFEGVAVLDPGGCR
jgi:hypothetical protein